MEKPNSSHIMSAHIEVTAPRHQRSSDAPGLPVAFSNIAGVTNMPEPVRYFSDLIPFAGDFELFHPCLCPSFACSGIVRLQACERASRILSARHTASPQRVQGSKIHPTLPQFSDTVVTKLICNAFTVAASMNSICKEAKSPRSSP